MLIYMNFYSFCTTRTHINLKQTRVMPLTHNYKIWFVFLQDPNIQILKADQINEDVNKTLCVICQHFYAVPKNHPITYILLSRCHDSTSYRFSI